jgi:uncharacterized Zn finger protein
MRPVNVKDLQHRARDLRVRVFDPARPDEPFTAVVESSSNSAFNQIVTIRFGEDGEISARCTCTWAHYGGMGCTHVMAALLKLADRKKRALSFWSTAEEAQRQKQRVLRLRGSGGDLWITSRQTA